MTISQEQIEQLLSNMYNPFINESGDRVSALTINPPVPEQDPCIKNDKAQAWISLHSEGISRQCAEKIVKNTIIFSFKKFYNSLQESVNQLNQFYQNENIDAEKSIIVVPHSAMNKGEWGMRSRKSNAWVTSLGLPFLNFVPNRIVDSLFMKEFLKANPQIKRIIFFDDTAYSGTDMSVYLDTEATAGLDVDFVIPFLTNTAMSKFKSVNNKLNLCYSETIPIITEMDFSPEEINYLNQHCITGDFGSRDLNRITLTILAHKQADSLSTAEKILAYGLPIEYKEQTRDKMTMFRIKNSERKCYENTPYSKFIPTISPPYKLPNPTWFLSDFINNTVSFSSEASHAKKQIVQADILDSKVEIESSLNSRHSYFFNLEDYLQNYQSETYTNNNTNSY